MNKNITIRLDRILGAAVSKAELRHRDPTYRIRDAETSYYRKDLDEAIIQEFDGRYGYLYTYDLHLSRAGEVPIRIVQPDLHVIYILVSASTIHLSDQVNQLVTSLPSERARYLYVPPGTYTLLLPVGHTVIFGFYFSGKIFRDGSEQEYPFLQNVLAAYRADSVRPVASIDFEVGVMTLAHIKYLFAHLRKGHLDNEKLVLNELFGLIQLSKKKVLQQALSLDVPALIAEKVHDLISFYCGRYGIAFSLSMITAELGKSNQYLNGIHKERYGQTMSAYKQQCIVEMAKTHLEKGLSITETAYMCNFDDGAYFSNYFKEYTGLNPRDYIASLE